MGLGRRSAPSAPPIPSRPLPPSAYGIGVTGAPVAPGEQFTPPPPPSAPPAAAPSPFADFAPPAPATQYVNAAPAPAIQYATTAPPTPAAAPGFGGYTGPADPYAAPPTNAFGQPPVAYGTPTWSTTQPAKKQGTRLWAKILAGAFSAVVGFGFLVHLFGAATVHHIALAMPATIGDTTLDTSDRAQSIVATATAREQASGALRQAKHFQAGIYRGPSGVVVADMADIPSNSGAFRDGLVNSFIGNQTGTPVQSVTPGKQGGTESCGNQGSSAICIWVDNGTVGTVVVANVSDVTTAEGYLQAFRDQVEH